MQWRPSLWTTSGTRNTRSGHDMPLKLINNPKERWLHLLLYEFSRFSRKWKNHLHLGTEGHSLLIVYLCAPVYMNGCENTYTYFYTYELKQHVGMGLLVSPLNLCGQVIPAARDSPRQELALSVIPLTFVPPSFFCAIKFFFLFSSLIFQCSLSFCRH